MADEKSDETKEVKPPVARVGFTATATARIIRKDGTVERVGPIPAEVEDPERLGEIIKGMRCPKCGQFHDPRAPCPRA